MKTWLQFLQNLYFKFFLSSLLFGVSLSFAQTEIIPSNLTYPGIFETFEKLIQIDREKNPLKDLTLLSEIKDLSDGSTLSLDPDFLNSIILHSEPSYLRLASSSKCRFYEALITDLLKGAEGKIKSVRLSYKTESGFKTLNISKKEFLQKIVPLECPDIQKMISLFQVKNLQEAFSGLTFDLPGNIDQCRMTILNWLDHPKTPYLCQIQEYIKEAKSGQGDPQDLSNRKAIAKILESKQSPLQREYLNNLCENLDNEELFCDEFLNVTIWGKIAAGYKDPEFAKLYCEKILKKSDLTPTQLQQCLGVLKRDVDSCLYSHPEAGVAPHQNCDFVSTALTISKNKNTQFDCPGKSDQQAVTHLQRILSHFYPPNSFTPRKPCASISSEMVFNFNQKYQNDENWKLEACYFNKIYDREICKKVYFSSVNSPQSYANFVAEVLRETRGAPKSITCEMISQSDFNPLLLSSRSGCFITYNQDRCFLSSCPHKIVYNDREIDLIKVKGQILIDYFPSSIKDERTSQDFILTRDDKKTSKSIMNVEGLKNFLKKNPQGLIQGIGCFESLMPSFVTSYHLSSCEPLPFIIDGYLDENGHTVLSVRTSLDPNTIPRLISWSSVFNSIKSYQKSHPLKLWTLNGLY